MSIPTDELVRVVVVYIFPFSFGEILILKISIFLASLQIAYYSVSISVDEMFRNQVKDLIVRQLTIWFSLLSAYEVLKTPNFQIWSIEEEKNRKLVDYKIILPKNSKDTDVEKACNYLSNLELGEKIIKVTAFEQNDDSQKYNIGCNINSWAYVKNRIKNINVIHHISYPDFEDHVSLSNNLGIESLKNQTSIPDEWFGQGEEAISIGRKIWEIDQDRDVIMRPTIKVQEKNVIIEVGLLRYFDKEAEYKNFFKSILRIIKEVNSNTNNVYICLFYRDTTQLITKLEVDFVSDISIYQNKKNNRKKASATSWISVIQ